MSALDTRLRQLQERYASLTAAAENAITPWTPELQADIPVDLWASLYGPYVQYVQWQYVIPANDDMLALVRFNLAVSIHAALAPDTAPSEPSLEWLPKMLCDTDACFKATADAVPLWSAERLAAYIRSLPAQEVIQRHAIPHGLVGAVRGVARVPPLDLSNLVQGVGWTPAPDAPNYQATAAMTCSGAPLNMDALFGTL